LLLALVALAGRLAVEEPQRLAACFAAQDRTPAAGQFAVNPHSMTANQGE
jgi:hypothetical protein